MGIIFLLECLGIIFYLRSVRKARRKAIDFDEEVTGNIALLTEDGKDIGWLGKVEGNKAILELVRGRELRNKTPYVIRLEVSDFLGNSTDI